jgi:hypothetical protein
LSGFDEDCVWTRQDQPLPCPASPASPSGRSGSTTPATGPERVLERCGFRREGLVRHFRLVRGVPTDYWLYAAIPGEVDTSPPTDDSSTQSP